MMHVSQRLGLGDVILVGRGPMALLLWLEWVT
jgi:hypothetical protein